MSLVWVVWCVGPLGTAMRVRVLHAKLYAYALPGSTASQLFISSTLLDSSTARQLLDRPRQTHRPRQNSTHRRMESASTGSTRLDRQGLDNRLDSASTEPRQLDSSTATGLNVRETRSPTRTRDRPDPRRRDEAASRRAGPCDAPRRRFLEFTRKLSSLH